MCGWADPYKVSVLFIAYIVADFVWIWFERDAVPSLPNVILLHHAVTFALLCFPLRYPEELAVFTCWDGLCEINTFFLIARRQWKPLRRPLSVLYWATFFPLRIFLYPFMLLRFYQQMQTHPVWEMLVVCGSQLLLIGFNVVLLALSAGNWRKRSGGKSKRSSGQADSPAAAGKGGVAKDSPRAIIKAQAAVTL